MTETAVSSLSVLLDRQRRAFERDAVVSVAKRADRIDRVIALLVDNQFRLCESMNADFGQRSVQQSRMADIFGALESLKYAKKNLQRWMQPEKRKVAPPLNL